MMLQYLTPALLLLSVVLCPVKLLNNGVALTPPMGFLHWQRFKCNVDCDIDPNNCVSEHLFKSMTDVMVADGWLDVGYEFVAMDDCWLAPERDEHGRLQPDPKRFPSGIKALAEYIHERGMKFGIYEAVGTKTCKRYPGTEGHWEMDAWTFAEWGVDMLKLDGCSGNLQVYNQGYPAMGRFLNETGRPIVYSCEWPMYIRHVSKVNETLIAATCNMARQYTDIHYTWSSVIDMIEFFGNDSNHFRKIAGPGIWNDPDQVVIGDTCLSHDQERVQMALYAILASPLMVSADLRNIRPSSKAILQNKRVITINQDPLGIQGARIKQVGNLSIWTRPILPKGSYAVAFLNTIEEGYPLKAWTVLSDIGLSHASGYNITEVFEGKHVGLYKPRENFTCYVNPTGVQLYKAVPLK